MKKLLALFLTLALCFSMFATLSIGAAEGEAENENETETETQTKKGMIEIPDGAETVSVGEETYTVLRTEEDLAQLKTANGKYLLANDIDFGGETLSKGKYPIAGSTVFDGNGFSFLNYTQSSEGDFSLFDVGNGTVLKNLTLGSATQKIQLTSTGAGKSCGAIVSWTNATFRLENVHVWADLRVGRSQTGGLVANLAGSGKVTFVNCSFHGSIVGDGAAGDAGYAGFIGQFQENATAVFENCQNYATVSTIGTETKHKTAGFIGKANGKNLTMTDCANYGNISTLTGGSTGGFTGESYISQASPALNWSFTNCVNYGKISGVGRVGGMLSYLNCSSRVTAGVTLTMTNCGNYGDVSASGADSGGLIGNTDVKVASTLTVTNCFNMGNLSGNGNNKGGVIGSANFGTESIVAVTNFLNMGSITSGSRAAAVTGWLDKGKVTVSGCVSLGAITGKGEAGGVLAIAVDNCVVKDCLAATTVTTTNTSCGVLIGGNAGKATTSGNYYMKSGSANTAGGETELTDWAGVAKVLNEKYSDRWGKFMLNTDENGVVPATPKLAGVQDGKSADGSLSVRFIATLQNTLRYERVGFKITVNGGAEKSISCKYVYLKLTATENGAQTEVSAAQLGGSYLYALTVNEIPATGTVTFAVIPFADDMEGVENPQTYLGSGYTVTYVDGVYVGATPIAAK